MSIQPWFRWPRYPLALFLGTTLAFLAGLGWMGWEAIKGNEAERAQRVTKALDASGNLISLQITTLISDLEQQLTHLTDVPADDLDRTAKDFGTKLGDDAVVAVFEPQQVRAYPARRLLYYPMLPAPAELGTQRFAEGNVYEFQLRDAERAMQYFRDASRAAADPAVRGAALLRLAANQKRAGREELALDTYRELAALGDVWVDAGPADLVARLARCSLLKELRREGDREKESRALAGDLHGGRWRLTNDAYEHYADEVDTCLAGIAGVDRAVPTPQAVALTETVSRLWDSWSESGASLRPASGPSAFESSNGRSMFVMTRGSAGRFAALVAGPGFVDDYIIAHLRATLDSEGVAVAFLDNEDREIAASETIAAAPGPEAEKRRTETRLPWTTRIVMTRSAAESARISFERPILIVALALLAVFVIGGSYFTVRGLTRELEAAQLQSDFVAAVSHEFRTPLTLLRQFSDLLVEGRVSSDEERQKYYAAIRRGTRRLTRLVEDLLDFGRMEAGSHKFRLEPLAVQPWLTRLVGEFQEETRSHGYDVQLSWSGACDVHVRADEAALGRAVWNLLDNAVKYSPDCKTIWVSATVEPHQLSIGVRDRGIGVPLHEQQIIFKKFVRGQTADAHVVKGTGLGLALVEQIVGAHGGRVLLDSSPGEGSTFSIVIALHAVDA